MENTKIMNLQFESPSLFKRLKSMLSVDFYRLFHTSMFYIFLLIAAIIPAMVLGMTSNTEGSLYTNTWQIIASNETLYIVHNIGEYANMNMVYIFGGIMISIFIGHDFRSGYVKQLFTTHPKKQDYVISKTLIGSFSMTCMCITYLIGTVIAGLAVQSSFDVNVGSLILALLGKIVMTLGWSSFYTFLNTLFRRYFTISIGSSFFFGTGIIIILLASLFGNSPALNIFLYGASVNASLSSTYVNLLICIAVSISWSLIYGFAGSLLLSKKDVY